MGRFKYVYSIVFANWDDSYNFARKCSLIRMFPLLKHLHTGEPFERIFWKYFCFHKFKVSFYLYFSVVVYGCLAIGLAYLVKGFTGPVTQVTDNSCRKM